MRRRVQKEIRFIVLSSMLLLFVGVIQYAEAGFRVGAAKVDITPTDDEIASSKIWLGGWNYCGISDRTAKGVLDRIQARAIVISDGTVKLAFVVTDVPGQSNRRIKSIRNKVNQATGIPINNILVAATHTHSGPDLQGLWCGVSSSYKAFYDQRVAEAVIQANARLQDATLKEVSFKLPGYQKEIRGWNITDDDLSTIQAVDLNGRPIATLLTFAAHAIFLGPSNRHISRDWPGVAQDVIEARGGGIAIYNAGAQGACNAKWPTDDQPGMVEFGTTIANIAYDHLSYARPLNGPLAYKTTTKRIAIKNGLFLAAYTLGRMDYDLVYPCSEGGGLLGFPCVSTQFSYLRFGPQNGCQLQAGSVPGELLTRGSIRVKERFTAPHKLILGLTNDTLGYAVPSDEWLDAPNGTDYHENVSPWVYFGDTVVRKLNELSAGDCY
jgi:hypothetical protein